MPAHSRDLPAEDSWRVVDGEHDSFDTSILPSLVSFSEEDGFLGGYPSSGQPSSALPSQLSSGDQASQDSIRDFARHREDDNVILREPFRPTMPLASTSARSVSGGVRRRQRDFGEESGRAQEAEEEREEARHGDGVQQASWTRNKSSTGPVAGATLRSPAMSLLRALAVIIALLSAAYLIPASFILYHNFKTYPRALAAIPICRMPFVPVDRVAECHGIEHAAPAGSRPSCIDFDDFDGAHHTLDSMLLRRRHLAGLSSEAEQAEAMFNQLRSLVEDNNVAHKSMVLRTFSSYRAASNDIIGGVRSVHTSANIAVDEAIRLAESSAVRLQLSAESQRASRVLHLGLFNRLFSPFEVPGELIKEYIVRQSYIQHAEHLSAVVSDLLDSVARLVGTLGTAGADVRTIIRLGPEPTDRVLPPQGQLGWNQWTLLAVKSAQLRLVHQGMQVLNGVLTRHELAKANLELLVEDLQMLKQDLDTNLGRARSLDVTEARDDNCTPDEIQIERLHRAAVGLRDALDSSRNDLDSSGLKT